jgi:pimeloyl-ACP methyl ester carboxylesterase
MLRAAIVATMRLALTSLILSCAVALSAGCRPTTSPRSDGLEPCRIQGIEREVLCGRIVAAENPDQPAGRTLEVHFAVVPAIARNAREDPVFVLAGGPGQAATRVAGTAMSIFAELNARRDIVFIDQRGTGKSNALECPDNSTTLAATLDPSQQLERVRRCLRELKADTRQYATWIAVRDFDAVRRTLGAERINLWGASYGTRAALEYLRQFPQHVRTVVLDGVAPPDMALPAAFAVDADAALAGLVQACQVDADCRMRYPDFAARIQKLLQQASAGFDVTVRHPLSGESQTLRVDRRLLSSLLRVPLYVPSLAAVLPYALAEAGTGDFGALVALSAAVGTRMNENVAVGMHFAVICAEDMPRVTPARRAEASATRFGTAFADLYTDACAAVATRPVPDAFYEIDKVDVPVLVLSGGLDPATPPRHGAAVADRLGHARHVVAPNLGHGISAQSCAPRLITRFIRDGAFAGLDFSCLEQLPAARFFAPIDAIAADGPR